MGVSWPEEVPQNWEWKLEAGHQNSIGLRHYVSRLAYSVPRNVPVLRQWRIPLHNSAIRRCFCWPWFSGDSGRHWSGVDNVRKEPCLASLMHPKNITRMANAWVLFRFSAIGPSAKWCIKMKGRRPPKKRNMLIISLGLEKGVSVCWRLSQNSGLTKMCRKHSYNP